MRLILDTNVVTSALLWGGTPYQLFGKAAHAEIELYTSPALLAELANILTRPHLLARLAQKQSSPATVLTFYQQLAEVVEPVVVNPIVQDDPDDDHVIACALAADADWVVTGDKHLLNMQQYNQILIITAARALAWLESGKR